MRKLFLRIYLGILLALFVGMVIADLIETWPYDDILREEHAEYISIVHPLVVDALNANPPDQWRSILDKWEGITEYQLELLTKSGLDRADSPEGDLEIEASSTYLTDYMSATVSIPDTNQALHYVLLDSWGLSYIAAQFVGQLAVLAAIAVVTYLLIRPLYTQTQELSATAQKFAQGKLDERVPIRGGGAFAELSQQFNRMADDIQRKIAEQKIMTDAISHELKTPITRLRLALDMALATGNIAEAQELLAEMDVDLNDLDGLASQLLTLAKLTYQAESLKFENLRIYELIEREMDKINDLRPGVKLSLRGDRSLSCCGHAVSLAMLFHNLLINGQRYAAKTVQIELDAQNEDLVVRVEDDGPGIPKDERDRVFAPFSRLDKSRNRSTGGYGLGLAIVHQCVEEHGGSIHISDTPLGGAHFIVQLPREAKPKPSTAAVTPTAHRPTTAGSISATDRIAS